MKTRWFVVRASAAFAAIAQSVASPCSAAIIGPRPLGEVFANNAAAIYPDRVGYVVVQSEPVPGTNPYFAPEIELLPRDTAGVADFGRRKTAWHGNFHSYDWRLTGTATFQQLHVDPDGTLRIRTSTISNEVAFGFGNYFTDSTYFRSSAILGSHGFSSGQQGGRNSWSYGFFGDLCRDTAGGISAAVLVRYFNAGDIMDDILPTTEYTLEWLAADSVLEWEDAFLPEDRAAGTSRATSAGIVVSVDGATATLHRLTHPAIASESLAGFPTSPAPTLLACAENVGGEVVAVFLAGGNLKSWSTVRGTVDHGAQASAPEEAYCWFDESGQCHVWLGRIPSDDARPRHLWRNVGGDWTDTNPCGFLGSLSLDSLSFDMTRLGDLRVATIDDAHGAVHRVDFAGGAWTATTIDQAVAGESFDTLNAGGIAGNGYLALYRRVTADKSMSEWMSWQEGGIAPAAAAPSWAAYE